MKRTIILLTILALMGLSKSAMAQTDTLVSMKSNADTISISVKWPLSAAVVKANGVVLSNSMLKRNFIPVNENGMVFITTENDIQLTMLDCYSCQLTELDITNNTALTELRCSSNQLTELDLTNNTALMALYCHSNQLTELDITHNTALSHLECSNNPLTALDVTNNTELTLLYCHYNQLTELDITNNTELILLLCTNNQLTALDITNNTALATLLAKGQQIEVPILEGATTFPNPILYKTPEGEQMIEIESVEYAYQAEVPITGDTMRFTTTFPVGIASSEAFSGTITFVTETSIAERQVSNINIYPNPVQHTLYIQSEEMVEQVGIYDISGRMLLQETNPNQSIDISHLSSGIYLAKVRTVQGETIKKVVKN